MANRTGPKHDESEISISVVIPHLNQPEALAHCLASLADGRRAADEIIVVDNGSTSLPEAICAGFPGVTLLQQTIPGPGPARNLGVAHASGTVLAFIDADCIAGRDWLAVAARVMADPGAEILGGDVRIGLRDKQRITLTEAYESIYAYRMDRYIAKQGFTGTGNLVVRRSVLDEVGPFAGLEVAEDRDWGQRATTAGHRIRFVPQMKVYHPAREDFADLRRKWDRHSAHDYTAMRQLRGGRLRWTIRTLAMAVSPLAEFPRIMASDRIKGLRARMLAFVGLLRIRLYRARVMLGLLIRGDAARLSGSWNRDGPAG